MENLFSFYDPTTGRIMTRTTIHQPVVDDRKLIDESERVQPRPLQKLADEQAATTGLLAVPSQMEYGLQDYYIDVETKQHVRIPMQPSQYFEWNWQSHQWTFKPTAKYTIWQQIATERDRRSLEGGALVEGTWYHSDAISRAKYSNIVMTQADMGEWKAMGGQMGYLDSAKALEVLKAISANDAAIFKAAQMHRLALDVSDNPERYDWHGGWPLTYQEATA